MPFYIRHHLAAMRGFGDESLSDPNQIFPGFSFAEHDSARDWMQTGGPWNDGGSYYWHVNGARTYNPISQSVVDLASTNWTALLNAATIYPAGSATGLVSQWRDDLQSSIDAADKDTRNPAVKPTIGSWTYSVTRVDNFNNLNDSLTRLSQVTVPDPDAELQAANDAAAAVVAQQQATAAQAAAKKKADDAKIQNTASAIAAAQQALTAAKAATAAANAHAAVAKQQVAALQQHATAAAPPPSSSATPFVLAGLGIVALGAGIFAFRRKKTAVAGYRKRRRR